jgi:DNA-binding GntR family transcriptional regulator
VSDVINNDLLRCDHGMRRPAIVQSLLSDVIGGRLRAGDHLVTQGLADRFGVSHTPVREALMTLAGLGLVELQPNRGALVRRVSADEVREVCQVRRALECEAVRRACGRIDPDALSPLADEMKRLAAAPVEADADLFRQARELDDRLHDLIAASCGNRFLAAELNRLKLLFRAFRDFAWRVVGPALGLRRVAAEAREHLAIVEALQGGDRRAAVGAMARHIRSGLRYWGRALPEPTDMTLPPRTKRSPQP